MMIEIPTDGEVPSSPTPDECVYIMSRHIDIIKSYQRLSYEDFCSGEGMANPPESPLQMQYDRNDRIGLNVFKYRKQMKLTSTHPDITEVASIMSLSLFKEFTHPTIILQQQMTRGARMVTSPGYDGKVQQNTYNALLHDFFKVILHARRTCENQAINCLMVTNHYLKLPQHGRRGIPIEVSEEEYYGNTTIGNSGLVNMHLSRPRCYFNFSKQFYMDPIHFMKGINVKTMAIMENFDGVPETYQPMTLDMGEEPNLYLFRDDEEEDEDEDRCLRWRKKPQVYTPDRLLQFIDIQTSVQYTIHKHSEKSHMNIWLYWVISNFEDEVKERLRSEQTYLLVNEMYEELPPDQKKETFIYCSDVEYFGVGPIKEIIVSKKKEGKHCRVYAPHI